MLDSDSEEERREDWDPFYSKDDAFYVCLERETFEAAADRFAQNVRVGR